jgi:delta 1-pyrroline-5-carboxylate dehydrogenase
MSSKKRSSSSLVSELLNEITIQGAVAALHMMHCFHLAGFPKGLISCVTGKGSEIGDFLTMHPGVNCIRYWDLFLCKFSLH